MKLWLLRHGQAQSQARTDAERELTEQGRAEVLQALAYLGGRPLQAIFASPYVRAQQTAALIGAAMAEELRICTVPWLTPASDTRKSLGELQRCTEGQEILLVSHQPFIGAFGGLLIHGHGQAPLPMHTASLAELEGEELLAGLLVLKSLHHPS